MSSERLLREYVREVLREDGDGGYTAGDIMMSDISMNPYGIHYGSGKDLYHVFVEPFTDIFKTAAGKSKEITRRALTVGKVAFETIATTIIPILRDDYKEIFDKEREALDKIKSEYAEVYNANWDAFRDPDFVLAAFWYSPALVLTTKFVRKAPDAALDLVSVLSGGTLDDWVKKVKHTLHIGDDKHKEFEKRHGGSKSEFNGGDYYGGGELGSSGVDMGYYGESVIRETDEASNDPHQKVMKILTSDKLKQKLSQSPVVRKMEQEGQKIVRHTLEGIFKQAQGVLNARSLQDLQNKTGAKLKGIEELSKVPQQERAQIEQKILQGTKGAMKEFYTKNLEGQVKQALDSGIPQDHPYVQDYQHVISKIKGL